MAVARAAFHKALLRSLLTINTEGIPGNADKSSKASVAIAMSIATKLAAETGTRLGAQKSGAEFEDLVAEFVANTFLQLPHLRPGNWLVKRVSGRDGAFLSTFRQYAHLAAVQDAAMKNAQLRAALGNDYTISPDVIVARHTEPDANINARIPIVDTTVSMSADLRSAVSSEPFLHASISTKWTLRSDRAQNARSEALNLIRNRKGRQPHIMVVTGEPTPSRLASLCLGTGDIDCVYHFALPELVAAVRELGNGEAEDLLAIMVDGKRLKDISDLPLDLAV
ncbi:restriction endonuclease [Ramlibacter sp. WS9]|nr:restriction endonuclease [Ramlibacter sp. WS9]